jgi:hypothetical protein
MISVAGRGLASGRISIVPIDGAAVIRVDDDGHPEFWLEISIPLRELLRIAAAVDAKRTNDELPESLFETVKVQR